MRVDRYRPNYFTGFDEEYVLFDTVEELLKIPWVASWTEMPDFYRFSVDCGELLMAEFSEGKKWFVIAMLSGSIDLPEWEGAS